MKRTGQAIALHWSTLVLEIVAVVIVFALFGRISSDAAVQPEHTLTASYIIWTLRILQLLAQLLVIVFLTRLLSVRDGFADARLIYIVLIIVATITFGLNGMTAGGATTTAVDTALANNTTPTLLVALVVLELVAKPVLLALGNRTILSSCASVLDSFGLYKLGKKNSNLGVYLVLTSMLLGIASVVSFVLIMLTQVHSISFNFPGGGLVGASGSLLTTGWDVLVALVACAAVAFLVLWGLSARGVGRTYNALRELSS